MKEKFMGSIYLKGTTNIIPECTSKDLLNEVCVNRVRLTALDVGSGLTLLAVLSKAFTS